MKILWLLALFVCLCVSDAEKQRFNKLTECHVGSGFDCSKGKLRKCAGSPNIKKIRKYCFAMKGHDSMMKELQFIFDGSVKNRQKRMLVPLEAGYSTTPSFEEGSACSVGGGTMTTFDGYSHTLTAGPCTYALALDRSVSKLVVYGVFESHKGGNYANKLSYVAIYVDRTSLVLGEDFDVNYRGIGYDTPAMIDDRIVVWRDEQYIYAEALGDDFAVRWDPAGQLRISVGNRYINETLGLCGMFNGDSSIGKEHNSFEHHLGNADMSTHDFGKAWALVGCFHEDTQRTEERVRNCDKHTLSRLCSVTLAAPHLAECMREKKAYGQRYREECIKNLCLCDELDSCIYSETLRISNECRDRSGLKIKNEDLRSYLDGDFIQNYIPKDHVEVPSVSSDKGDVKSYGQPFNYRHFAPDGSCYVYGHNYVRTFDGVDYSADAYGCTYPLVLKEGIQDFTVYGTFQAAKSSGKLASSLKYISFFDIKNRVRIQLGQGLEVNYEGTAVQLPYHREFVSIWFDSDQHYVYVYDHDLGVEVRWDGQSVVRIRVDNRYRGSTKGLCGTFNGDKADEINLLRNTRVLPSTFEIMVQEWKLPSCSFNIAAYDEPLFCVYSLAGYTSCLNALTDVRFSFCVSDIPPIHFVERCEADLCRCGGDEGCKCEILSAYAQMCQDTINTDLDWRTDDFCPRDMCLFDNNGCKHNCSPPGTCSCEEGFTLGSDGKSCVLIIDEIYDRA